MVNSSHTVLILLIFSAIVFDSNYAAVRKRRTLGLIFGKSDQTTTKPLIQSPLGFVSISLAGGQKKPEDPCNPSENKEQSSGRKPLIDIKIPTLINKGSNQATTAPHECTTVSEEPTTHSPPPPTTTTHRPPPPSTTVPTTIHTPKPTTPIPIKTSPAPTHSTSSHGSSSGTVDPDQELIDSIFGPQTTPTPSENNGAGFIDLRKPS